MKNSTSNWRGNRLRARFSLALLALITVLARWSPAQVDDRPPQVGEGCLLYRSPIPGRYDLVPLVHTDVAIDVRGLVASATVSQQYSNSATEPVEAIYVFPLPPDAAVYDMEIRVGNRVIRSEIHEREEAKRVYQAAKSEGKRAALLEQERPNIFTTSVSNIMPGDQVSVRLRYAEPLRWEDGRIRLVFPMVVGPRYIPGTQASGHSGSGWAYDTNAVADASRITPPVRNPESRSGHDISLAIDLDLGFEPALIRGLTHEVNVRRLHDGRQHVELATGATLPNKDFVLEVQQAENPEPKTALFLSPGNDTGDTQFLLATYPPAAESVPRTPVEMLYMIDVSGSMAGTSIEQARGALLQALDRLSANDRFGILAFSSGYREFAPEPLAATSSNLRAAREYVQGLSAGGGTEMLPALVHLMRKPQTPGTMRHIILMTDGDLGNEEEIFASLRSDLGNARLYTVAVGSAPNLFLATKMAQFGRGTFTHIADINEITEQMTRLFDSIDSPVLSDVKLSFEGVEAADVYPDHLPDLFLGQPLLIYGRIAKGRAGTLHLTARAGNEPYEAVIRFDASQSTFHPGVTTLWARQHVEDLMDRWRQSDENERQELRASVIAHAIRYRLVTRFTSLVAVEQVVVNAGGHSETAAVPTELPDGWQMDKVFGAPATGTADAFWEALGVTLLLAGLLFLWVFGKRGALA
ncbi:MAG: marine proteobacterial sortase target protein [Terriglobales bacterium]|jgi:Ca-activated chloride channel family protein